MSKVAYKRGSKKINFSVILLLIAVVTIVGSPLFIVWKQVHLMDISRKKDMLTEKVAVLKKEATALTIVAKRLSSADRVEQIAKNGLGLDYPKYSDIVVIKKHDTPSKVNLLNDIPLWAVLKKSLSPEKKIQKEG